MEVRISVRNLVEFILRAGNIDNRRAAAADNAMQEGGRIHRMIQRSMGSEYHAEVPLRYICDTGRYSIIVEGRADGVIIEPDATAVQSLEITDVTIKPEYKDCVTVTIDEIKCTYRELSKIKEPAEVHLAQAKCYSLFYGMQNELDVIRIRMTYCNIETEEIKYFHFEYSIRELEEWFEEIIEQYKKWADYDFIWRTLRQESISKLEFPFEYRNGQKELVTYAYQTMYHKRKLFIEAPTGVGKTISTVFPAIKAMGEGMAQKLFYLTAKTITRKVADDTISLLRSRGLKFKSVILTAKDKICFMEETECNPDYCPYAKGHYDRINDAIYALLTGEDNFNREKIEEYAQQFKVCPFEMCLDMSLFADAVIGDYNYLFDPHVYLKRFFAEGSSKEYLFLIDEAHNLVDRGREMYSAVLKKEDFLELKKLTKEYNDNLTKHLERCNKELLTLKRECEIYEYQNSESIAPFVRNLDKLSGVIDTYLEEHEESPIRKEVLAFYFEICHFLLINDFAENQKENYEIYTQMEQDGSFILKLFCVNPSENLKGCMKKGRSTILFSATLLPIQYYKRLLGAEEGDYEVYAKSVFNPERKALLIADDVTSKYSRRTDREYYNIASYIHKIVSARNGNYMVFFPSYLFMRNVYEQYREHFLAVEFTECILQEEFMNEQCREEFLNRFAVTVEAEASDWKELIQMDIEEEQEKTLVGFCILGGIFSEGIDLKNDSLIGAVIVGTGFPQVCNEREILKNYFDRKGENGFDYAYQYPGMNKVLQAAGRVIRTVEDIGIIALLDERFLKPSYLRLFPREWDNFERVSLEQIENRIDKFWNDWL